MLWTITNENWSRVDEIVSYLTGPRLWIPHQDYPDFDQWVQRVHQQLRDETKRALVALERGNVIGAVIYQKHRTTVNSLEIKNITVRPDKRGRHLASFLLRNAEIAGSSEFQTTIVNVDAKSDNVAVRSFLLCSGYAPIANVDLYGLGSGHDIVFEKRLPHQE